MNLIARIRKAIAPPCDHTAELSAIEQLRTDLHDARNIAQGEIFKRELAEHERDVNYQNHTLAVIRLKEMSDAVEALASRNRKAEAELALERDRCKKLGAQLMRADEQLVDATGALEQANARIAILEQQLRDDDSDEQTSMPYAPAEGGGEPPAVDVLIDDVQTQLTYRLVGLFFDDGRHHWLLAQGENRIKAALRDKTFIEQMNRREVSFAVGDAIKGEFHVATYRTPDQEVYAKTSIVRVISIIKPPSDEQLALAGNAEEASRG